MKRTLFLNAVAFFVSMMSVIALDATTVVNTVIQYCTGTKAICQQGAQKGAVSKKGKVNAIGDVVHFDVSKYSIKFLGTINEEKLVTLALPEQQGEKVLYSFKPTTGEFAGKLVYVVFDYLVARPGTRIAGKSTVMLYRSLEGATATDWTEIATITIPAKDVKLEPIQVTLKPDGTGVWMNPHTNKPEVFLLGKKEFTAERLAEEKAAAAQKATDAATQAKPEVKIPSQIPGNMQSAQLRPNQSIAAAAA